MAGPSKQAWLMIWTRAAHSRNSTGHADAVSQNEAPDGAYSHHMPTSEQIFKHIEGAFGCTEMWETTGGE